MKPFNCVKEMSSSLFKDIIYLINMYKKYLALNNL